MSLIQQALKRQQDEAKGKVTLPPPHLGSTQLAVKPTPETVKPVMFAPAPPIEPPKDHDHQRLKLVQAPASGAIPTPVDAAEAATENTSTVPEPEPIPSAPPPPPATLAAPVSVSVERESSNSGGKAWVLVFLLLALGFAGYRLYVRSQQLAAEEQKSFPAAQPDKPVQPDPVATPAPKPPEGQPVAKHTGPLPDVKDIKTKTKTEAMSTAVAASREDDAAVGLAKTDPAKPVTAAPVVAKPVEPAPAPNPVPVVAKPAPAPTPVPVAPAVPVNWPTVSVNGLMPNAVASRASAIINGTLISVGESVDGLTLLEVRERGVLMELKGEQKFHPIGRR